MIVWLVETSEYPETTTTIIVAANLQAAIRLVKAYEDGEEWTYIEAPRAEGKEVLKKIHHILSATGSSNVYDIYPMEVQE